MPLSMTEAQADELTQPCMTTPRKRTVSVRDSVIPKLLWSIIVIMNPLLPIADLVIIGNNEPIITVIIGNNGTVIIRNNDVII